MSSIKGFLCSFDGTFNFPLSPKVTTIGRENCDIIINNNNIDSQHAVIEFMENENCYVLQDLNTVNGTYINDCRIQNAAVRLAEHDTIRFGFNGILFQFVIQEHHTMPTINSNSLKPPSGNQTLQVINQTIPLRGNQFQSASASNSIWLNNQTPNGALVSFNNSTQNNLKPPASLRTRPYSAGNATKISVDPVCAPKFNGWVKGYININPVNPGGRSFSATLSSNDQQDLNNNNSNNNIRQSDPELHNKIFQLEKEIKIKNNEIRDLSEKVNALKLSKTEPSQNLEFSIKSELEQVKRDKSIATGLINTMQKDLTNKDATISKLARELENFKREYKERENSIKELTDKLNSINETKKAEEERQSKERELVLLRNKFKATEAKVTELNNQVLQIRNELEDSQKKILKNQQNEKSLKDELEGLKIQYMDMQRAERTVRIDLEQSRRMYEKFRNLIIQTIYSTPGVAQPTSEVTDDDLVKTWKSMIDEKFQLQDKIESFKEQLTNNNEQSTVIMDAVMLLNGQLLVTETRLNGAGRRSEQLKTSVSEFENLTIHNDLIKLRDSMADNYRNQLEWQNTIENCLSELGVDVNNTDSILDLLNSLNAKIFNLNNENLELRKNLEELEETYKQNNEGALDALRNEYDEKFTAFQNELNEKNAAELEQLNNENQAKLDEVRNQYANSNEELLGKINSLTSELENSNNEIKSLNESLLSANEGILQLKTTLQATEDDYSNKIKELEDQKKAASLNYSQELDIHKEQIKQHSLTIINLEREITYSKQRELDYLHQIENLKNKKSTRSSRDFDAESKKIEVKKSTPPQIENNQTVKKSETLPQQSSINSVTSSNSVNKVDTTLLEKTIENLKNRVGEQDEIIKILRRDLISVSAKLTDVHSDLPEKQKRELERNKILLLEQTRDLTDSRAKLAKLSEIVDKQNQQIDTLKTELSKSKATIDKYKANVEQNGSLVLELKAKLDNEHKQLQKIENTKHEEGKIATELTSVGAQCRGERHEQVIARQKEALNELRQRVKILEQTRPAVPLQQQQMQQQIVLLKKQLAEYRANQALSEDISKQAIMARGGDENLVILEEKTSIFEAQAVLETSEETYMSLLRSIASMLELREIDGLKTLCSLPPDERERLVSERNKAVETICLKLKSLKEALQRKEKLLQDYESDLAKLRQTEFLLKKKSEQLDEIQLVTRNKDDEIHLLKESLKNARTRLDDEILHNNVIKHKRPMSVIGLEKIRRNSSDTLHHHCPPDDINNKVKVIKKNMNERIKKKDYELKSLREELKSKQNELSDIGNRLKIIENSQV